jgi:hypothetical protein
MFDRICGADNGIRHLLTTRTRRPLRGVERHEAMKAEFFTPNDRMSATAEQLHAALNAWVTGWNAAWSR